MAYDCLSGSHCVVKEGHSRAVLSIKSYRKGEFFFQVLYSSLIIFSFIFSSSGSAGDTTHNSHLDVFAGSHVGVAY